MNKINKKIITQLRKKRLKLAIAESCTGGMLSSNITSVSGSSKVFVMGFVTYSNQSKNQILKIPQKIIKKYGAVSSQCCYSMVNNLSKISKCDVNISITGIAGPKGGTKEKPIGLVYVGIKKAKKIKIKRFLFKNKKRPKVQQAAVKKALEMILKTI
tara:strand:+ start:539 stop:1009 length:471 start_codon:yes stop_codon:yes gene_type:complete